MVEESAFRGVIGFMGKLGVYDVILPFLLVFTIIFAILEKTKILGVEKVGDTEVTKKNLNSMVAVIVAFLVIASTKLVAVINEVMAQIVLLLLLGVSFLLLVGVFFGSKEFTLKDYPTWTKIMMVIMFLGVVAVFLNSLGWLGLLLSPTINWDPQWTISIIFLVVILAFMWYITKDNSPHKSEKKD